MQNSTESSQAFFCLFQYKLRDAGSDEKEDFLQYLIYRYPSTIADSKIEFVLRFLVSMQTYIKNAIESDKILDFLSLSNTKIAIRTYLKKDGTTLFFVLRVSSKYSDFSISRTLDHIKRGLFFVLGPDGFEDSENKLKSYLEQEGEKIFSNIVSDNIDPITFSFINVPNAEWHRPNLATVLTVVTLMQTYPEVWGIVCFSNDLLLASHSPIDIVRFFNYVQTDAKKTPVYLTRDDRNFLMEFPGSISNIPDLDVIEASLVKFQHKTVVFYLLTDPQISQNVFEKIHETLTKTMVEILNVSSETKKHQFPPNTLVYNNILNVLNAGPASEEFQNMAISAHDLFAKDDKLRDMVLHNAREFSVCMNIIKVEHYASVNGNTKGTKKDLYDEALKIIPNLISYMKSLHFPQEQ